MRPSNPTTDEKQGAAVRCEKVIAGLREMVLEHLALHLRNLATHVDERLLRLTDRSGSARLESEYVLTLRLLRREASALQEQYTAAFLSRFDRFWDPAPASSTVSDAEASAARPLALALVSEDAFEEDLAVSGMADKGRVVFAASLFQVNQRVATMVGVDRVGDPDGPLGPGIFCRAFAEALRPLPLDVPTKLLVYKLFDQIVLQTLGRLYAGVDQFLAEQGIEPQALTATRGGDTGPGARAKAERRERGRRPAGPDRAPGGNDQPELVMELFEELQEFLDQWRGRLGIYPNYFDAPAARPEDVMDALEALQRAAADADNAQPLKARVHWHLERTYDEARSLARREEDIIDMVGLLFDFILEEPLLPDPVKLIIARLQVPFVKVAILERSFFARKNHPARLLLNALAQAGMGLELDQAGRDPAILNAIEAAVHRVLDQFEQNALMFSSVLDEFLLFMERDAQRSRVVEERTLRSSQSREQLLLCKRRVAQEIASRLHGRDVPTPVRSFLFNQWKDVMLLAYLRRDRSAAEWAKSVQVVDRLVQAGSPAADGDPLAGWAELKDAVKSGLENVSLDPLMVRAALSDLKNCLQPRELRHATALQLLDDRLEIQDPDLLRALSEIRDSLPAVECHGVADTLDALPSVAQPAAGIPTSALVEASKLVIGQWVEFKDEGRVVRAKLSWRSQITDTHVFVNRKGAKVAELSLAELAARYADGSVQPVSEVTVPLMDRALEALVKTLKGPEPAPASAG